MSRVPKAQNLISLCWGGGGGGFVVGKGVMGKTTVEMSSSMSKFYYLWPGTCTRQSLVPFSPLACMNSSLNFRGSFFYLYT